MKRSAGMLGLAVLLATFGGLSLARGDTNVGVTLADDSFSMPDLTIAAGDTVTWTNGGVHAHNVHFDDGPAMPGPPSTAWSTVSRRFTQAGTYAYHCDMHAMIGMTGTVTVTDGSTPSPTPTPTPTPPGGGGGTGGGAGTPPATLRSVAFTRDHFCTKRSRTCKKPGVVLSIDLSAPAAVTGTLSRAPLHGAARYKRFGSVDFGQVAAGKRELRFNRTAAGKRVTPARYKLVLKAAGTTRTLRFRVRPS